MIQNTKLLIRTVIPWATWGIGWIPRILVLAMTPLFLADVGFVILLLAVGAEFGFAFIPHTRPCEWGALDIALIVGLLSTLWSISWVPLFCFVVGDLLFTGCKISVNRPYRAIKENGELNKDNLAVTSLFWLSVLVSIIVLIYGLPFFLAMLSFLSS